MTTLDLPMLGLGSPFAGRGYFPKIFIAISCGRQCHRSYWTLYSFRKCLDWHLVLRCASRPYSLLYQDLIKDYCHEIGFKSFEPLVLDFETTGQAHTFHPGAVHTPDSDPVCCFNIDSIHLDFDYSFYRRFEHPVIETFKGPGDHWSFVKRPLDNPVRAR